MRINLIGNVCNYEYVLAKYLRKKGIDAHLFIIKPYHKQYLPESDDPEFRNQRIAYKLFVKTLEYLKNKSDLITTGLEVHNLPSLNLHSKIGFRFNYTHNVYHWWSNV